MGEWIAIDVTVGACSLMGAIFIVVQFKYANRQMVGLATIGFITLFLYGSARLFGFV